MLPAPLLPSLFDPLRIGPLELSNRVVMAPMTRNRAGVGGVPTRLNALYYAQRASAGLIVSEGTQPSTQGQGYPSTPGLHTDDQQAGWAQVADAVHDRGGLLAVQLMHAGRISHPEVQAGGAIPVGPSAVRPAGEIFTGSGLRRYVAPRPLEPAELPGLTASFAAAAGRACAAGVDAVELHAGNGYLLHQFLAGGTNRRTDTYGGSPARRIRLIVEVAAAAADAIGGGRVGVRVTPGGTVNDIHDPDSLSTHLALVQELDRLGLGWLHVVEPPAAAGFSAVDTLRPRWRSALIANGAFGRSAALTAVATGRADAVSFGRVFAANPDLPRRLVSGARLAEPDSATFYGGDARGYTDYPTLEDPA